MLKVLEKLPKIFGHIYTMLLVLISWVIFTFEDLGQIGTYLSTMFDLNGASFANPEAIYYLKNYIAIIIIGIICSIPLMSIVKKFRKTENKIIKQKGIKNEDNVKEGQMIENVEQKEKKKGKEITWAIFTSIGYVAIIILSTASPVNNSFNPFLYFRF